ncbi:restriction endonuclease subunit S [Methanohalophilus profundi]|uniref:restriction endonuclease subunit S n=1 Tax=Methanohalophilus profundi TaxID=2138083 RepID=UPI00101B892E|nr:restriction endonuclease subunit S [Methanohalophilus profundi]
MNSDLLSQNFATLIEAPGGINALRQMILQLAVRGKLVSQNPDDEPASVLLDRIAEEKKRLQKEGKLKRQKKLPPIDEDEVPYEVPQGWEWKRLGSITHNLGQKKPDKRFIYIDVSSIDNKKGTIASTDNILEPENAPSRARKLVSENTVIYSTVRPYLLNIAIIDKKTEPEMIVSTAFAILHPYSTIYNKYLYYYLKSLQFTKYVESQMIGMAYPAINDSKLLKGLVPLPPIAEQHRIVAKVDKLMNMCDELERKQQKRSEVHICMNNGALSKLQQPDKEAEFNRIWAYIRDNFDLLYTKQETVKKLREAVLQLAVQGRLVEQDPNDEPAEVLLERIEEEKKRLQKEGKLKRQKELPPIEEDEVPYELPQGWEWARMGDVVLKIKGGGTPSKRNPNYWNGEIAWASVKDLNCGKYLSSTIDTITEEGLNESSSNLIIENNIIICTRMGLGKISINQIPVAINQDLKALYSSQNIDMDYFYNLYNSLSISGTGMTVKGIRQDTLLNMLIPLPPLAKQHRIVEEVDRLLALCDRLEANIKHSEEVARSFAEVIEKVGE